MPMLFPDDPMFSMSYAQGRLAHLHHRLRACVGRAWTTLDAMCGVASHVRPALAYCGTMAHLMNALVVEEIRREFPVIQGADHTTYDGNRFLELQVRQDGDPVRIDLRFKKYGDDGTTMNTDTPAQNRYRNLFGEYDDVILRLTVSWRWNAAATDLEDVRVQFVKGYDVEWHYSINDAADEFGDGGMVTPMPTPTTPPSNGTMYRKSKGDQDTGKVGEAGA